MYLFKKIQVEAKNARGIERMHQEDTRGSKKFQRNGKNASLLNCQRSIIINNFKKHIIYLNNYASISVFKKYKLKNKLKSRPDGLQFLPGNNALVLSVPGKVLNKILFERMKEALDPRLRDQ